ncbi:MliC family protein [Microbulbifer pacificus]|uniref:MliC family protein n=1 Tax=Microbulbifer pacificus TaxID=407164 RepID=A0AAU0N001_9GAMM|nr:MliC family protein [Microbulbifer pacificus]WOX05776.1 MliC family protein [Microbulbifer pacificus]
MPYSFSGRKGGIAIFLGLVAVATLAACERNAPISLEAAPSGGEFSLAVQAAEDNFAKAPVPRDAKPSYDCSAQLDSSIEELICSDKTLAALDRQMAEVFAAASNTQTAQQDKYFKASQRGWIKGRNDCWKAEDKHQCVAASYQQRISELQIQYRLVPTTGSATYLCDGLVVTVTYFATEPPALLARYKGGESIMRVTRSGSGSHYVGRNESIWEHQGEATIVWGYGAPEMYCKVER